MNYRKVRIHVKLHAHYILTETTLYRTSYNYIAFGSGSAETPALLMQMGDTGAIYNFGMSAKSPKDDTCEDFSGFLEVRFMSDMSTFTMEDFLYITPTITYVGVNDTFSAMPYAFCRKIVESLFNAITDKDFNKIDAIAKSVAKSSRTR